MLGFGGMKYSGDITEARDEKHKECKSDNDEYKKWPEKQEKYLQRDSVRGENPFIKQVSADIEIQRN